MSKRAHNTTEEVTSSKASKPNTDVESKFIDVFSTIENNQEPSPSSLTCAGFLLLLVKEMFNNITTDNIEDNLLMTNVSNGLLRAGLLKTQWSDAGENKVRQIARQYESNIRTEHFQQKLSKVYTQHNPEKLNSIPSLIEKYKNQYANHVVRRDAEIALHNKKLAEYNPIFFNAPTVDAHRVFPLVEVYESVLWNKIQNKYLNQDDATFVAWSDIVPEFDAFCLAQSLRQLEAEYSMTRFNNVVRDIMTKFSPSGPPTMSAIIYVTSVLHAAKFDFEKIKRGNDLLTHFFPEGTQMKKQAEELIAAESEIVALRKRIVSEKSKALHESFISSLPAPPAPLAPLDKSVFLTEANERPDHGSTERFHTIWVEKLKLAINSLQYNNLQILLRTPTIRPTDLMPQKFSKPLISFNDCDVLAAVANTVQNLNSEYCRMVYSSLTKNQGKDEANDIMSSMSATMAQAVTNANNRFNQGNESCTRIEVENCLWQCIYDQIIEFHMGIENGFIPRGSFHSVRQMGYIIQLSSLLPISENSEHHLKKSNEKGASDCMIPKMLKSFGNYQDFWCDEKKAQSQSSHSYIEMWKSPELKEQAMRCLRQLGKRGVDCVGGQNSDFIKAPLHWQSIDVARVLVQYGANPQLALKRSECSGCHASNCNKCCSKVKDSLLFLLKIGVTFSDLRTNYGKKKNESIDGLEASLATAEGREELTENLRKNKGDKKAWAVTMAFENFEYVLVPQFCDACRKENQTMTTTCSGSCTVKYCNHQCQKKHWKEGGHKKKCSSNVCTLIGKNWSAEYK